MLFRSLFQEPAFFRQIQAHATCDNFIDCFDGGDDRYRFQAKREPVINGRRLFHPLRFADQHREWQAVGDTLAVAGEIWQDTPQFLCAADRYAEAGNDFIENQESALFMNGIARGRHRRLIGDGPDHWIDDEAGDLVRMGPSGRPGSVFVRPSRFGPEGIRGRRPGVLLQRRRVVSGDTDLWARVISLDSERAGMAA